MFSTNKKMDDFVLIINSIKTLQVNDGENWNYIVDAFTTTTVHTDFNVDSVQMLCKNTETDKLFILDIGSVKDFKVFSDRKS